MLMHHCAQLIACDADIVTYIDRHYGFQCRYSGQ